VLVAARYLTAAANGPFGDADAESLE